jgi:serine phosphatase RsbU (regulator of sigma subunit)
VLDVIKKNRTKAPEAIVSAVFDRLSKHSGGVPHADDLTLVVLRN